MKEDKHDMWNQVFDAILGPGCDPYLFPVNHMEAVLIQREFGGVIVRHPTADAWCVFGDPKKDLPNYRPDLTIYPLSIWIMVAFDEKRLIEMTATA